MGNRSCSPAGDTASGGRKLRILLVSSFAPQYKVDGGIAVHLGLLRRELENQGHTVFHLASAPGRDFTPQPMKNTSFVYPALRKRVPFRYHVNLIREYRKIRRTFSPDLVHLHSMSGLGALVYEKETPVLMTLHSLSTPYEEGRGRLKHSWPVRCFRFIEHFSRCYFLKRIFRDAARVILVSEKTEKEVLRSCPGLKTSGAEVLSPGIDLDCFRRRPPDSAKRELGFANRFVLLFVGRMVEAKRPLDIVQALPAVLEKYPDTLAVLIGDGPDFESCEEKTRALGLAGQVRFIRGRKNHELPVYYNAADIFINPTGENETFGLATVEAMACGTPVVISRAGASTGVVSAEEAIIFSDVADLSNSILKLRGDKALRLRLTARGMALARKYSADATIRRLGELYEKFSDPERRRKSTGGGLLFFLIMVLLGAILDSVKDRLRKSPAGG